MTEALEGKRVLVVEDDALVGMLLESILEDLRCIVLGPASTLGEANALIATGEPADVALLDVNVSGELVFPVAEALAARGVPIIFSTGYGEGGLAEGWRGRPTLQKPFTEADVKTALAAAVA